MGRRAEATARLAFASVLLGTVVGLSCAAVRPARAASACAAEPGDASARVAAVGEALEIRLDDGRLLRLAGLDVPPAGMADARRALASWADAGPVAVHTLAATPDRWGRLPALLFRPGAADSEAAIGLIAEGLARAAPEPGVHPCFAAWLDGEERAREAKRGLWAAPGAAVLRADDADALSRASGGFVLIEGILQIHAARGGTLYLTLGRDRWGFAAVLTRRDAARFAKEGLDVKDYAGTPVRLRGALDDRFGARILLTDPDQFQSLEPGALAADSQTSD